MTTAYTPILKLALPVTGELDGTWGDVVNNNITSMVEQAVAGLATVNTWTANSHTLTTANGTTSESRCAMLVIDDDGAGNPSAAATVICPTATKSYIVRNLCGQTVTVKTSAGTGVAVPNNQAALVFCDGTNVVTGAFNGDVVGPATATNNAIVTFDGTTGKLIKDNSGATISAGVITATGFAGPLNGTVGATTPATGAFTTASATTGNITTVNATTVNATTVDTTNIEVTNLKAKDGTAAGSISDITGIVTIPSLASTTGNITTVNATTVNATTVDTTNLEVTSLKAKDGTAAGSIADSTGVVTLASSVLTTSDINGGTIDGAIIGGSAAAAGSFTNLSVTGTTSFDGSQGTNGQVLTSAGTGNTPTWTTPTLGTVTSVTGTAPVVSSGGTTPAISIPPATTSANGYLTSTDWNTFNSKTSNTGTVTSVAATAGTGISVSGSPITTSGTLTITNTAPDQTVSLTAGTGISTSGTYPNFTITNTAPSSGGTVTSVTGAAPVVSSGGTTPAISMAAATGSVNGYLTSTDWNTFNNKTSNTGTVTSVSASVPAFLSVSGSPITTSGTLAISYSGTALPVANGGTGVTSSTGSGSTVLSTSPTLTTPNLGTPTSGTLSNCTVDGTNSVGFRNIPQNLQSAAYTLVMTDSGKHILHPSADTTARTYTIPASSSVNYPLGTAITFVNQNGAGVITISITSDTLRLAGSGATGSRTLTANGVATAIKVTPAEWIISGVGLT